MSLEILEIIEREMDIKAHIKRWRELSPFQTLVRTILSQNTTDKNSLAAFDKLESKFGEVTPEILAAAEQTDIQDAIRSAGLHNQKSKRIKEISNIILTEWNSDFSFIYEAPLQEARKKLMALPGIGNKTADILLNFVAKRPILPVDTHIMRISKRIGLVPQKAKYDEIREGIEALIPEEKIFTIHVSLIFFGRVVCKAINPQCPACPIADHCPKLIVQKKKHKRKK